MKKNDKNKSTPKTEINEKIEVIEDLEEKNESFEQNVLIEKKDKLSRKEIDFLNSKTIPELAQAYQVISYKKHLKNQEYTKSKYESIQYTIMVLIENKRAEQKKLQPQTPPKKTKK